MSKQRYQLWMRLMFFSPGNPAETRTQGRVNFAYRILDTQAAETTAYLRSEQDRVLADGYSLWGQSDDDSHLELFAREMEGQQ